MNEEKSEMGANETEKYLTPGPQTQITPEVEKIVSEVKGTAIERTEKILEMGPSLVGFKEYDVRIFRKRTGSQILQDKYITGCADAALVFITLARASGVPVKYVETIDEEWLRKGGNSLIGHVYAQVYDELKDQWVFVDPMKREVNVSIPKDSIIFKEGLDSWEIGIKDFETQEKRFKEFREEYSRKIPKSKIN